MKVSQSDLYRLRCEALIRDNPQVGLAWAAALAGQLQFGAALAEAGLTASDTAALLSDAHEHAQNEILRRRVDA